MQPFICPRCGHESSFDPRAEAAICPQCSFTPPTDGSMYDYVRWANRTRYQPFLDELWAHWNGTHIPDTAFAFGTSEDGREFFRKYRRTLGLEAPNYRPKTQEILVLVDAYAALRRGDRSGAAEGLQALTMTSPLFVEPWIWLTATTDDTAERLRYLERATRLDSGHAMARDALVMAQRQLSGRDMQPVAEPAVAQCPQCGMALEHEPSMPQITCPNCGHQLEPWGDSPPHPPATLIQQPEIGRQHERHDWAEAQQIVRCPTCGVQLAMLEPLMDLCAFCGSAQVLSEEHQVALEQPDGFLPFEIDSQQAWSTARKIQHSPLRRLAAWWTERQWSVRDLQGVYVPFWVFEGTVETYRRERDPTLQQKESLSWAVHQNLLYPGVRFPSRVLLSQIQPFDPSALTPYKAGILANWPAMVYNVHVDLVAGEARQAMLTRTRRRASRRPRAERRLIAFQVIDMTYRLLLLPMWLVLLEYQNQRRLVLMNGQTGKATQGPLFLIREQEARSDEEADCAPR